jgi:predicted kinase
MYLSDAKGDAMSAWQFPHVPQPPGWRVMWDDLAQRFAWLRALAGVPQEPTYHAEGDVLVHTRMVAEALAAMEPWRGLPPAERGMLFAAALLHDAAKPARTRVEPDGRITSPGHARMGEHVARHLLWTSDGLEEPPPFAWREVVARLVRWHGLPLWFFDKADPQRAVIAASMTARLEHVALLAEADVRGRICDDQGELLDRIALFRDYCEEQRCYTTPRPFPSDYSRFVYFHRSGGDPDYAAYDDTVCEVVLMSGLPGAGKDTWLRDHRPNLPLISLDAIRREQGVAPTADQGALAREAKRRARELLRRHQSFVWNATNVTRALRGQLVDLFASYKARVRIVYVEAFYATLLERNRSRSAPVPPAVIERLARKLEVPDVTEAHAVEWIADGLPIVPWV